MIFLQIVPAPVPPPPPPGLPIDVGLVFLLIMGVFYGVLKTRKKSMIFSISKLLKN